MDVARALRDHAAEIAARVTDAAYRNPFWTSRFGERGRVYALEDAKHHVDHLARALEAGDVRIMRDYARWLQTVLTTRGMCTRHLDDNFVAVGDEARRVVPEAATSIATIVAAAQDALRHQDDAARRVQSAAAAIAARVVDQRAWSTDDASVSARARCLDDMLYHLSYLADSIALRRPELFVEYAIFIASFLEIRGVPVAHLEDALFAMANVSTREGSLTADDQRHVRERVEKAVEALRLAREATA